MKPSQRKRSAFIKKNLILFLLCTLSLGLSACSFDLPEGYTEEHHTYEEILAFAKAIDPEAAVSEEYIDTSDELREYPAVICGIECHVSSVLKPVWTQILHPEFAFSRWYYAIDTDYDYHAIKELVSEHNWRISDNRYPEENTIFVYIEQNSTEQLTDEELTATLEQAKEIYSAYHILSITKEIQFFLPSPSKSYRSGDSGTEEFVYRNSYTFLGHSTEKDNLVFDELNFISRYRENWALLDSGLPIVYD